MFTIYRVSYFIKLNYRNQFINKCEYSFFVERRIFLNVSYNCILKGRDFKNKEFDPCNNNIILKKIALHAINLNVSHAY